MRDTAQAAQQTSSTSGTWELESQGPITQPDFRTEWRESRPVPVNTIPSPPPVEHDDQDQELADDSDRPTIPTPPPEATK